MSKFYRVAYYWNSFKKDEHEITNCGTHIHIMGSVYEKIPSKEEIINLLKKDDLIDDSVELRFTKENDNKFRTQLVEYSKVKTEKFLGEDRVFYVGVISVLKEIEPVTGPEEITDEVLGIAVKNQSMDISDFGKDENGIDILVIASTSFENTWKFHGYDVENIEEDCNLRVRYEDEVFRCEGCDKILDISVNTYQNNQKFGDDYKCIGVSCGCYAEYCLDNIEEFIDNPEAAMDSEAVRSLVEKGLLTHYESLCSGWSCCSSDPGEKLEEFYKYAKENGIEIERGNPNNIQGIVFSVDNVGMFDVEYSMYIYKEKRKNDDSINN